MNGGVSGSVLRTLDGLRLVEIAACSVSPWRVLPLPPGGVAPAPAPVVPPGVVRTGRPPPPIVGARRSPAPVVGTRSPPVPPPVSVPSVPTDSTVIMHQLYHHSPAPSGGPSHVHPWCGGVGPLGDGEIHPDFPAVQI